MNEKRGQEREIVKLFLDNGELNVNVAIKEIDRIFSFVEEALSFFKEEIRTDGFLNEVSWFFNTHRKMILDFNKIEDVKISKKEMLRYERIVQIFYNSDSWVEEPFIYKYDTRKEFAFILLFLTPKVFLSKLKVKPTLLEMINIQIANNWFFGKSVLFASDFDKLLEKKFLTRLSSLPFQVIYQSFELDNFEKVKRFTKNKKRLLEVHDLDKLFKSQIMFWEIVTVRANYSISPNKKYTDEMFKMTSEYILKGYREYVAFDLTLENFNFSSIEKRDSYRKSYKAHIKKRVNNREV